MCVILSATPALCHCGDRIAAADDDVAPRSAASATALRDADRSLIKWRFFKHAHRAIPDDRASRPASALREVRDRLDADVHADETDVRELDRDRLGDDLLAFDRLVAVDDLMVRRQQKHDSLLFARFLISSAVCIMSSSTSDLPTVNPSAFKNV
jgi:hypothetical protein